MKKTLLLLISLCCWIVSAASSTPPLTIINALDISAIDQLVLTDFTTTTYQFAYGQLTPESGYEWSVRDGLVPAPWPEYGGQNTAYGSGHLNFDRSSGETSGAVPFLTPISFVNGQPVYDGKCLMTPAYNPNLIDNAAYMTAYSLSFQVRGAGTLSFLAKLSLEPDSPVDFNTSLPPDHLVHLFDTNSTRMIILLDGEEIVPNLESESGYDETGFEYDNRIDEETRKRPIETGADWGLYSLEIGTDRYNHKVEILVLLPGKDFYREPNRDLTTAAGVRAVYGSPDDNDADFSPCFYRVWFDDFRWLSYEAANGTSLSLVTITPDAAAEGGVFQNVNGESHYTYTFPQASNLIFLSSDYDNIVFMYTLDGSEPTVDSNGNRNDSTFLYDDVLWDPDEASVTTRYVLRTSDEAGIDISAPSILKVKAYEKIGEATYIPTDGLTYPKKNLAGLETVYHYVPRVPTPEMQLLTTDMPPTPLRPGGTLRVSSTAPAPVTFYYTLDGSTPAWQSNGLPSGTTVRVEATEQVLELGSIQQADLPVTAGGTQRCIAVKADWVDSEPASLTLEQATAPVIDLAQSLIYCQDVEWIFTQEENGELQQIDSGDPLPQYSGYFLCQTTAPGKLNSECVTVMNFPALQQGWNLLVLPGRPGQLQIPPNTIAGCFVYDVVHRTYTRCTEFVPGQPFWVFALADTDSFPLVISAPLEQLTLTDKWNFAGGIRKSPLPAGVLSWGWQDNRFQFSGSMLPWEGFWLFPPQAITISWVE